MSAEKLYSEIFEEFEKAETKEQRINVLRRNYHPTFRDFLIMAFNPNIVFDVEIPDYRPAPEPAGLNHTYLDMEVSKLYRFIKDHPKRNPNLTDKKKKQILTVILEALHKDEAELLVKVIKKQLKIKNLTVKLIQEAYGL
jgi:hypothetical protein